MRIHPFFVALLVTAPLAVQPGAASPGPDGIHTASLPGKPHPGLGRDLVVTLTEVLNLNSGQVSRLDAELKRLRKEQQEERARHHRAMRERHHRELRELEQLLEPHQAELYRAFLRGLELRRSTPPPHHPPQREITRR